MGRPRQFDEERALERALDVFWRRGYVNTSIQDLVDAMEINRGSLYASFGDKQAVFMRALETYRGRWGRLIAEQLQGSSSPRAALVGLLEEMARQITGDHLGRGCLLINSAFEFDALPLEAQRLVQASLA